MSKEFELIVKGTSVPMNDFVRGLINDLLMAILKNLRGIELDDIKRVEVN